MITVYSEKSDEIWSIFRLPSELTIFTRISTGKQISLLIFIKFNRSIIEFARDGEKQKCIKNCEENVIAIIFLAFIEIFVLSKSESKYEHNLPPSIYCNNKCATCSS